MLDSHPELDRAIEKNQIRLGLDCYPFLDRNGYYNRVNTIKDSNNFGPNDCKCREPADCQNRITTIKVGFFLEYMKFVGLLNEFEKYLRETGRTIRPSYGRFYRRHRDFGGQTPPLP